MLRNCGFVHTQFLFQSVFYYVLDDIPVKRSKIEDEEDKKQDYEDWKRKILENAARAQANGTS